MLYKIVIWGIREGEGNHEDEWPFDIRSEAYPYVVARLKEKEADPTVWSWGWELWKGNGLFFHCSNYRYDDCGLSVLAAWVETIHKRDVRQRIYTRLGIGRGQGRKS